ncbi:MAG: efflux transporter outer membrane subunit [Nitrospirota bacterium]|nr:efflux transporter outer membrane subunit [Nitrospirota bacterium]
MSTTGNSLAIMLMSLILSSCLQGQDYQRPPVEVPDGWSRMTNTTDTSIASDHQPEAAWWKAFQNEELSGLIEQALQQNHDVKRALARVLEGRASVMSATAGLYPQMNLSSSYSNIAVSKNTLAGLGLATGQQSGPKVFATPGTTFDLWNSALDLRWEMDFWGRIRRGREAAVADAQAIEQDARAVALTLVSDLGQSYFRIRELDEQLDIAKRTLDVRQEYLDIIQKRASVGLASDLDVKRTEVLVAEAAGLIPDLARTRALETHRLEVLTGMSPGSLDLQSKPLRTVVIQPNIPVGLPSQLLERRPDILQAEATLIASNARIGQARAYFFPTLSITGQGGLQSAEFSNWFTGNSSNYSIGPSIILPIFQGGTNLARLDSAESRYVQMLESYQQTILLAFREVADVLTSLRARAEQLARQREQLSAAQEAVRLADIRYRTGLVNYLDVLDAQRTALAAETQLVLTERTRLTDMVSLFKALGGGWTPSSNRNPA